MFTSYIPLFRKFAYISVFALLLYAHPDLYGQVDSTYIKSFDEDFAAKAYFMSKIAGFEKETSHDNNTTEYRINAPGGIGVGLAWKSYSLSVSQRFSFMRDPNKGKTNSLEFQYNGFKRKFIYSVSLQRHKGFFDEKRNQDGTYTLYPDMNLTMYGGTFQWVFNNKRFSYRAAFNQNEKQLKSAGSFQLGAAINYSRLTTNSTIIFDKTHEDLQNLQFGIISGYAYTWVLSSKWYLTGAVDVGVNIGNNYPEVFFKKKMEVYPTVIVRAATGYNIKSWSLGFSMHYNKIFLLFDDDNRLGMNEFNLQLSIIKRFQWGNKFINQKLQETQDKLHKLGL